MLRKLVPQSTYARNVITLMTGTAFAQALPIAVSPILTRLYTPAEFGVFAMYMAIASILGVLVTGRYELAILIPKQDRDAIHIAALSAALSVFIALWNAVRERRADLAMLRMLGAPPGRVAGLVLWEALWLAALASMLGLLLGHGLAQALGWALQAQGLLPVTGWIWLPAEAGVPLLAAGVAALAALLPAMQAYRTDVADLLSQP